jgi:hypothetical protein
MDPGSFLKSRIVDNFALPFPKTRFCGNVHSSTSVDRMSEIESGMANALSVPVDSHFAGAMRMCLLRVATKEGIAYPERGLDLS